MTTSVMTKTQKRCKSLVGTAVVERYLSELYLNDKLCQILPTNYMSNSSG